MLSKLLSRAGCKKDPGWSSFVFQWLSISFILHIIAAVKSTGFYSWNEHFQILELVSYKLGQNNIADLPTEFHRYSLPWLLPAILTGLTWFLKNIGISSPFEWALSYRILAALIGWLSVSGLTLCCYLWFAEKKWRQWAVLTLNFIWYIPFFHARHSAENLGGSIFFLGVSLLLLGTSPKPKQPDQPGKCTFDLALIVGLLFGLAFEFQFDIVIMIIGILMWLIVISKFPVVFVFTILIGTIIPICIGTLADYWGYGQWVFTPWNYFQNHLIENFRSGAMELFSTWTFFRQLFSVGFWPPLGFLTLSSFVVTWVRFPKHVLTWTTLPLFLIYAFMPHRELYSVFPLIHVGGIMVIFSISSLPIRRFTERTTYLKRLKQSAQFLLGINTIALLILTLFSAWTPFRFYQRLYPFKPYGFQIYCKDDDLFQVNGKPIYFYRPLDTPLTHIFQYSDLVQILVEKESTQWLFSRDHRLPNDSNLLRSWCKPEFSELPDWLGNLMENPILQNLLGPGHSTNWTLYRCQSPGLLKSTLEYKRL